MMNVSAVNQPLASSPQLTAGSTTALASVQSVLDGHGVLFAPGLGGRPAVQQGRASLSVVKQPPSLNDMIE